MTRDASAVRWRRSCRGSRSLSRAFLPYPSKSVTDPPILKRQPGLRSSCTGLHRGPHRRRARRSGPKRGRLAGNPIDRRRESKHVRRLWIRKIPGQDKPSWRLAARRLWTSSNCPKSAVRQWPQAPTAAASAKLETLNRLMVGEAIGGSVQETIDNPRIQKLPRGRQSRHCQAEHSDKPLRSRKPRDRGRQRGSYTANREIRNEPSASRRYTQRTCRSRKPVNACSMTRWRH